MKNFLIVIVGALIGAAIVYFFCCKTINMTNEPTKPNGIITPEQIKTLDQAFNSRHQLISDSIVMRPDNRSSWYSLEDMRDYLDYAESQAKDLGYKMDGIRIYLGAQANEGTTVGYTTMFFVPTYNEVMAEGSMVNFVRGGSKDVPGGNGLDMGGPGDPPSSNYPQ
ncbi:MAG: hypothetical protein ACSHXF_13565 [Aquaticitalea sp.]